LNRSDSAATRPYANLNVPSTDIFVTYRCSLRCTHCFLGDLLNTSQDMTYSSLTQIIRSCSSWGSKEVTFLGGEPTQYPYITHAVSLAREEGLEPRIVTNGQGAFGRFIENDSMLGTHVCISIDGSCAETHDAIRGRGKFLRLMRNATRARERGFAMSGIVSISRQNASDAYGMLALCAELQLEYVNVHYVSSRGFASSMTALEPPEWALVCSQIERAAADFPSLQIRYERTFVAESQASGQCSVRDGSNLMFLPDGRVFGCMMFIDIEDAHAYDWDGSRLHERPGQETELEYVAAWDKPGCPALVLVDPQASSHLGKGECVECIYAKTRLNQESPVNSAVRR